jgi:hypothetical protein
MKTDGFGCHLGWGNIRHIYNIRIMNIFDLLLEYSKKNSDTFCYELALIPTKKNSKKIRIFIQTLLPFDGNCRKYLFFCIKVDFSRHLTTFKYITLTEIAANVFFCIKEVDLRPSGLSSVRSDSLSFPLSLSTAFLSIFSIRTSSSGGNWNIFLSFFSNSTVVKIVSNSGKEI